MKKVLSIFTIAFIALVLVGCEFTNTKKHIITFDTNGAKEVIPAVYAYEGKTINEPTKPTKEGYDFMGWFEAKDLSGTPVTWPFLVTKMQTLYAKWEVPS